MTLVLRLPVYIPSVTPHNKLHHAHHIVTSELSTQSGNAIDVAKVEFCAAVTNGMVIWWLLGGGLYQLRELGLQRHL